MFYTNETIKTFGYESQEQFVDWFVSEYKNCAIRFDVDGVYADYDLDSYLTYTKYKNILLRSSHEKDI